MPTVGIAAPVWGDVEQLGGLGDRLGTGLDHAGRPTPEVGLDAATTGLPLLSVWVGRVIGSTEPALATCVDNSALVN
jgi:hypothetical protein